MSRVAKEPVELPQGVEFNQSGTAVSVKGGNGTLSMELNPEVELVREDSTITVKARSGS
jgi:large subunit ribosomal protein L6